MKSVQVPTPEVLPVPSKSVESAPVAATSITQPDAPVVQPTVPNPPVAEYLEAVMPGATVDQKRRFCVLSSLNTWGTPEYRAWAQGWLDGTDTSLDLAHVQWDALAAYGAANLGEINAMVGTAQAPYVAQYAAYTCLATAENAVNFATWAVVLLTRDFRDIGPIVQEAMGR